MDAKHLFSPGFLAERFQTSVLHINLAAQELGIEPFISINEIPHFDEKAFFKLRDYFDREKSERVR